MRRSERRGRGPWFIGALIGVLAMTVTPAFAQDPPPPDSVDLPPDSVALPPDSSAAADSAAADSTVVVHPMPRLDAPTETGWAAGVWEWDHEALLATGAFTLTDLLERLPGVAAVRSGFYGMPETVTAFGAGGGRVEVVLDGYALDPLRGHAVDLASIELNELSRVRVERRASGVRIEVETHSPSDPRPYTLIQAAKDEVLGTQLFRGIFMTPRTPLGSLALGVGRLASDGVNRAEPATNFGGWLKWGWIGENGGLQLEHRRVGLSRDLAEMPADDARHDWILRGRTVLAPRLTGGAFVGYSMRETDLLAAPADGEIAQGEEGTAGPLYPRASGYQAGVRALYDGPGWWTDGGARLRTAAGLPGAELELRAGGDLAGIARVSGGLRWQRSAGESGAALELRADGRPVHGLHPFAELSTGRRRVPGRADPDGAPIFDDRTSLRAGAEFARNGLHAGAAAVRLQTDAAVPFGLPFDAAAAPFPGGSVNGFEANARLPLGELPLALEGSYTGWLSGQPWLYLPERQWRAALAYHHLPRDDDQLELRARLEAHERGAMLAPGVEGATVGVPALHSLDFYLQIRILSLRAFLRWENILHRQDLHDLPGRLFPGQRLMYGVKWEFWN